MDTSLTAQAERNITRGLPFRIFQGRDEYIVAEVGTLTEGALIGEIAGRHIAGVLGPVAEIEVNGQTLSIAARVTRPTAPVRAEGATRRPLAVRRGHVCPDCGQRMTPDHEEFCVSFSGGF